MNDLRNYTLSQTTMLVLLRIAIGWHFLFEGLVKVYNPNWSAYGYLANAHGPLSGLFSWMAESPMMLMLANQGTQWGLVFAGLSLMLGLFTTLGCIAAAGLLIMFYAANPAWGGVYSFGIMAPGAEGSYLVVNKVLIELVAVIAVAVFPTGRMVGLDALVCPMLANFMGRSRSYPSQQSAQTR